MSVNYKLIGEWLSERHLTLQPYFTENLRAYAVPYGKKII